MKVYIKEEFRDWAEHAIVVALEETPYLRHVSFVSEPGEFKIEGFGLRKVRDKRILLVGDSSGERWGRPPFEGQPPPWFSPYLVHHGALAVDRIESPDYQHGDCNTAELAWRSAHGRWGQGRRGQAWNDPIAAIERELEALHEHAAHLYVGGASNDRSRVRRCDEVETIRGLLARLARDLPPPNRPELPQSPLHEADLLRSYHIQRLAPWMTEPGSLRAFGGSQERKKIAARAYWAAAVGMKASDNWGRITGALLSRAPGHLIEHDARFRSLRSDLERALAEGIRFVAISNGWGYRHDGVRWRPVRIDPRAQGAREWLAGPIVSCNFGRVMVLPFQDKSGRRRDGYTRSAPGEGPAGAGACSVAEGATHNDRRRLAARARRAPAGDRNRVPYLTVKQMGMSWHELTRRGPGMSDPTRLQMGQQIEPCPNCLNDEDCSRAGTCLYERHLAETYPDYAPEKAPVVPLKPRRADSDRDE